MTPGLDKFDLLLEAVLSLVRVRAFMLRACWTIMVAPCIVLCFEHVGQ